MTARSSSSASRGGRSKARPRKRPRSTARRSAVRRTDSSVASSKIPGRPKAAAHGGFQWTLVEAAAMLSVTFAMFMIKEAASASAYVTPLEPSWQLVVRVFVLGLYYSVQVCVIVWLVRRRGGELCSALGLRHEKPSWRRGVTSAAIVAAALIVTRLFASAYTLITSRMGLLPSSTADLPGLFGDGAWGFLLAVLMVVLVGPAVEEAVFRGVLQRGLAARFGPRPAIAVQAAAFAAFHRSWWLLVPMFVLGIVLGWLVERRESLWPAIALHAMYNGITVVAAFLIAAQAG